jgi:hypothetical protein
MLFVSVLITKFLGTWDTWFLGGLALALRGCMLIRVLHRILGSAVPNTSGFRSFSSVVSAYTLRRGVCSHDIYSYLSMWTALNLGTFAMTVAYTIHYTLGSLRASRAIHQQFIHSVLRSTFRYVVWAVAWTLFNRSADGWVGCFKQYAFSRSLPNRHHAYISTACSCYAGHTNQCVSQLWHHLYPP